MSATTFVPLFVQGVLGGTPTQAGAAIAPMAVAWPLASALGGRLIPRFGFRPLVRIGLAINVVGAVLLAVFLVPGAAMGTPRIAMAVFGTGLGFANTALLIAVQSSVAWNRRGVATSSTLLFRTIGGTLAVGMLGELMAKQLSLAGSPTTLPRFFLDRSPAAISIRRASPGSRARSQRTRIGLLGHRRAVVPGFPSGPGVPPAGDGSWPIDPNAGNLDARPGSDGQLAQPEERLAIDDRGPVVRRRWLRSASRPRRLP